MLLQLHKPLGGNGVPEKIKFISCPDVTLPSTHTLQLSCLQSLRCLTFNPIRCVNNVQHTVIPLWLNSEIAFPTTGAQQSPQGGAGNSHFLVPLSGCALRRSLSAPILGTPCPACLRCFPSTNTPASDDWVLIKLSRSLITTRSFEPGVLEA